MYSYPNGRRKYVRIYTPDLSEVLWIIKTSKEIFDRFPIVGLDRPRNNKKLYIDWSFIITTYITFLEKST